MNTRDNFSIHSQAFHCPAVKNSQMPSIHTHTHSSTYHPYRHTQSPNCRYRFNLYVCISSHTYALLHGRETDACERDAGHGHLPPRCRCHHRWRSSSGGGGWWRGRCGRGSVLCFTLLGLVDRRRAGHGQETLNQRSFHIALQ